MIEAVEHLAREEGPHRLDRGAVLGKNLRRPFDRLLHLRLDRQAAARLKQQTDAKPFRRTRRGVESQFSVRQAHIVARIGSGDDAHEKRGVGHRARHRPGDAPDVGWIDRNEAEARLQGEDAAPGRGKAHRAADIGAKMQGSIAGGGRGAGT